jgi:glycosyltransferase involved in cell wall biosynthesis
MIPAPKADVIVPWERHLGAVENCIESVLEYSGPTLRRLFLVVDSALDSPSAAAVSRLAARDSRVEILATDRDRGFAACCNRGLARRDGDSAILRGDCVVTRDWLMELATVAHSEERTACASPLVNGGGSCSVPELYAESPFFPLDDAAVRLACAGLPRWTVAPLLSASCIYLRGDVIDAVGLLDGGFYSPSAVVNHWVLRAQTLGFAAKRSNHAYIRRTNFAGDGGEEPDLDLGASLAELEHGELLKHQVESFRKSLDGHLAAHAVRLEMTGKLRVAYDLRHLPREQVGTRTYAVCLGQALAELPDIELTLLVRERSQAVGLCGRVVTSEEWRDDVEIIHKPAQVIETSELGLLFESSAHLVVTYQDLIGYQIPLVFPDDDCFDRYRSTSSLVLPAVQRVIAYSANTRNEIAAEFGIPAEEIVAVPLGVDASAFSHAEPRDAAVAAKLRLPARYFFSVATDFPHKNLPNLLDAYAIMRSRWRDGEPPALVLAGYRTGGRRGVYLDLMAKPLETGIRFLGPVSRDQLRVLYQGAVALVFPSLYEGFGLPPLEAMAAGTPVVAMPISAVPEVAGDCVLYPDGFSPADLARSMELLATDQALHDRLKERGLARVEEFRWESTARATAEVYRSTVRQPSDRSLQMRRMLREAIFRWAAADPLPSVVITSAPSDTPVVYEQPLGIKNALRALNFAISTRLKRELKRLPLAASRSPASASAATAVAQNVLRAKRAV